jgi:hypothetical protein
MQGTSEFAKKWGVPQSTVAKWCRERKIPGVEQDGPGKPWRIPDDAKPPENYRRRKK